MAKLEQIRNAQVVTIADSSDRSIKTRGAGALLGLVYLISFFCGLAQSFEGVFLPEFKEYFHLSYQQQMYIVFAKNLPFVAALAVGWLVRRKGYKNTLAVAMFLYAAGTLLLVPGLRTEKYWMVLLGFMTIGGGFTFQMVAANPLMSALGLAEGASSRLNFGNALGAVAQIIAPATLTVIIPVSAVLAREKMTYIEQLFLSLGIALIAVAAAVVIFPDVTVSQVGPNAASIRSQTCHQSIWSRRKAIWDFIVIFLLLGVEASLFSLFRNYLESPDVAALSAHSSQRLFTAFFGLFALGRLTASWIQRHIRPIFQMNAHLLASAFCVMALVFAKGATAISVFLALGFLVSIFFPTFYGMSIERAGDLAPQASGLLTVGFLGCAIVPVVQGGLADMIGLRHSFWLCAGVYLLIVVYVSRMHTREKSSASADAHAIFVRN
ncbi:MFS transporter [Acidisarcina polymorpha]|nr:MFS transporter [Acidisarcina polymorpha]